MKHPAKSFLNACVLLLLAFAGMAHAQEDRFQEGLHYFEIEQAPVNTGSSIVVTEAFSYLCTHCNTFEPYLESWNKRKPDGVEFERIPVVFGRSSWEMYARGYVTAEMMDAPEEAHRAMMDRLWKDKEIMRSMDELATFYEQYGLDKDKFLSTSRSFAVDGKIRKDQLRLQAYGIRATPSLVLNGKYRIVGNAAVPSFEVMLEVLDYLIEREQLVTQQSRAAGQAAAESP
jgi:thiol:disulfide interchange protein DsbA